MLENWPIGLLDISHLLYPLRFGIANRSAPVYLTKLRHPKFFTSQAAHYSADAVAPQKQLLLENIKHGPNDSISILIAHESEPVWATGQRIGLYSIRTSQQNFQRQRNCAETLNGSDKELSKNSANRPWLIGDRYAMIFGHEHALALLRHPKR
jgi:hypothetical protein